jgi:Fur family transcriptional regulator, ferric uptake regulator
MRSVDILKVNGIKVTIGRKMILEIMNMSENALSAEQIYNECTKEDNSINLSTVYRTLDLLEEKNIVDKFDLGDGKYNYVVKKDSHKHVIQCSLCDKKIEVECPMKQVEELIRSKTGFTMIEHALSMKWICEGCRRKD